MASEKEANTHKTVSVAMASYNMGRYVGEAIESVLQQTYPVMEIHVVDDGSTDDTRKVLESFASEPKVICHFQENQGQPKAKNRAIRACKGEFVAFLDADDMWRKDKLEKQMPIFDISDHIGVVYTDAVYIDPNGNKIPSHKMTRYSGRITEQLLIENFVNGPSAVVRKECFDRLGVFNETYPMGIDYELWLRFSVEYEFYYQDEASYMYRIWPGQMSHNHRGRYYNGIKIMREFLAKHGDKVSKDKVSEAWAHTYVGKGYCLATRDRERLNALKDYWKALTYRPTYLPAWKAIVKLMINRD